MSHLLLWLAVPLLLVPWAACVDRRGAAAGQLVIAGLGLAALGQGVGTFDLSDLHALAEQSSGDAWFIGLTAGFIIVGGCVLPDPRRWARVMLAAPLVLALLVVAVPSAIVPLLVGALVGALPWIIGRRLLPRIRVRNLRGESQRASGPILGPLEHPLLRLDRRLPSLILAALTMVAALAGPLLVAMLGLAGLTWREWWLNADTASARPIAILPVIATGALGAWTWLALTISGSPWMTLRGFGINAPVSDAASEWLALIAIIWALATLPPWPVGGLLRSTILPLVTVVVVEMALTHATVSGLDHWQPLLTPLLVIVGVVAAARRRPDGVAAALILLAATRPGAISLAGALLGALIPLGRRLVRPGPVYSVFFGVIGAMVVASVLRDEVVLAVLLGFGLAAAANGLDHVVAGP
ncbi:MAG TPA: hypothetical protein VGL65_06635 [Gemmatimonadales bacterium]|jgi:hypothetical protein